MRFPIALGSIKPNIRVKETLPHFLQLLDKIFELLPSHILPLVFIHTLSESKWHHGTNKWECKFAFKCGFGKFVDYSGKRIRRIDGIGLLL